MDTRNLWLTLDAAMSGIENRAALNDAELVADCIKTIVHRIGMRVLAGSAGRRRS